MGREGSTKGDGKMRRQKWKVERMGERKTSSLPPFPLPPFLSLSLAKEKQGRQMGHVHFSLAFSCSLSVLSPPPFLLPLILPGLPRHCPSSFRPASFLMIFSLLSERGLSRLDCKGESSLKHGAAPGPCRHMYGPSLYESDDSEAPRIWESLLCPPPRFRFPTTLFHHSPP